MSRMTGEQHVAMGIDNKGDLVRFGGIKLGL